MAVQRALNGQAIAPLELHNGAGIDRQRDATEYRDVFGNEVNLILAPGRINRNVGGPSGQDAAVFQLLQQQAAEPMFGGKSTTRMKNAIVFVSDLHGFHLLICLILCDCARVHTCTKANRTRAAYDAYIRSPQRLRFVTRIGKATGVPIRPENRRTRET